jgi:hypothetical protein
VTKTCYYCDRGDLEHLTEPNKRVIVTIHGINVCWSHAEWHCAVLTMSTNALEPSLKEQGFDPETAPTKRACIVPNVRILLYSTLRGLS